MKAPPVDTTGEARSYLESQKDCAYLCRSILDGRQAPHEINLLALAADSSAGAIRVAAGRIEAGS